MRGGKQDKPSFEGLCRDHRATYDENSQLAELQFDYFQSKVMFCGFGGQGIVLAGVILGRAAVNDGLNVAQAASYGSEARGSATSSEVIISREKIIYPHIRQADILGAMNQQGYDKFHSKVVKHSGIIAYDESMVQIDHTLPYKQVGFPATETAIKELDKKMTANIIFISAIVKMTGIISKDALKAAVIEYVPEKYTELNMRALELGWGMGGKI